VGITLTAASTTCFVELGWTPGEHDQATDRCHRIGQISDSVHVYYLLAQGTIEDDICKILDKKRETLVAVLDGQKVEKEAVFSELIKSLKKKKVAQIEKE